MKTSFFYYLGWLSIILVLASCKDKQPLEIILAVSILIFSIVAMTISLVKQAKKN